MVRPRRVWATSHQPIDGRGRARLALGPDGLSWFASDDDVRTVRWDDAVVRLYVGRRPADPGRPDGEGPVGPVVLAGRAPLRHAVDDAIDARRRIRLGEGETQYRRDPDDPDSRQPTCAGSGASSVPAIAARGVDIVIDTDGFFLLFSRETATRRRSDCNTLSRSDRLTLLGTRPPQPVGAAERHRAHRAHKVRGARLRGAVRVLLVKLRDGTTLDIELVTR